MTHKLLQQDKRTFGKEGLVVNNGTKYIQYEVCHDIVIYGYKKRFAPEEIAKIFKLDLVHVTNILTYWITWNEEILDGDENDIKCLGGREFAEGIRLQKQGLPITQNDVNETLLDLYDLERPKQ